jgi:hypothetical protein
MDGSTLDPVSFVSIVRAHVRKKEKKEKNCQVRCKARGGGEREREKKLLFIRSWRSRLKLKKEYLAQATPLRTWEVLRYELQ